MQRIVLRLIHGSGRPWFLSSALAALTVGASSQGLASRFPVTADQVITAMQNRQLPTEDVQLTIAAPMTASMQRPLLEIQSIALLTAHTARLKVACHDRAECLPFYVAASWPEASASPVIPAALPHTTYLSQSEVAHAQSSVKAVISTPDSARPRPDSARNDEPQIVHAGTSAMLSMDQNRVHIRVRVICLQGGSAGDKVRVSTPDHKQAYVAEIVSPTLLKGIF